MDYTKLIKAKHNDNHDLSNKDHIRILSINGGGVKGYIPSLVIEKMEIESGKKIQDLFDYFIGTSVGGIIALSLVTPNKNGDYAFSGKDLPKLCLEAVGKVFPLNYPGMAAEYTEKSKFLSWASKPLESLSNGLNNIKRLIDAPYSRDGIDDFLEKNLGNYRFNDTLKPVAVFSYNENTRGPNSWTSLDQNNENFLFDAAGATSAAPTYLPPKSTLNKKCFEICKTNDIKKVFNKDDTCLTKCTTIDTDGGLILNNPTSYGYDLLAHYFPHITRHNVTIVSLGTGKVKVDVFKPAPLTGTGTAMFGDGNILTKALNGFQDTADFNSASKFRDNYLVLNPFIKKENNELDDASSKNMKSLKEVANKFLKNDKIDAAIKEIIKCLDKIPENGRTADCIKASYIIDHSDEINYIFSDKIMEESLSSSIRNLTGILAVYDENMKDL